MSDENRNILNNERKKIEELLGLITVKTERTVLDWHVLIKKETL